MARTDESQKKQPESKPAPEQPAELPPAEPTFTPFTPPREAGVWILGPNGPKREE